MSQASGGQTRIGDIGRALAGSISGRDLWAIGIAVVVAPLASIALAMAIALLTPWIDAWSRWPAPWLSFSDIAFGVMILVVWQAASVLLVPARVRGAMEVQTWIGERDLRAWQAATGSLPWQLPPTTPAAAERWLASHPATGANRWARIEVLLLARRFDEAAAGLASCPSRNPRSGSLTPTSPPRRHSSSAASSTSPSCVPRPRRQPVTTAWTARCGSRCSRCAPRSPRTATGCRRSRRRGRRSGPAPTASCGAASSAAGSSSLLPVAVGVTDRLRPSCARLGRGRANSARLDVAGQLEPPAAVPAPNMDVIVSLAKRRGFVFPSSEIYGGMAGFWDYGPLGVELKQNIRRRLVAAHGHPARRRGRASMPRSS